MENLENEPARRLGFLTNLPGKISKLLLSIGFEDMRFGSPEDISTGIGMKAAPEQPSGMTEQPKEPQRRFSKEAKTRYRFAMDRGIEASYIGELANRGRARH